MSNNVSDVLDLSSNARGDAQSTAQGNVSTQQNSPLPQPSSNQSNDPPQAQDQEISAELKQINERMLANECGRIQSWTR
jgi:hypothetical protein